MKIIYALEEIPESINKSLFLAGCTPRELGVKSWRKEALNILKELNFDGTVFVPEVENGIWHQEYDNQIEWEETCLKLSDCILFWIPRAMSDKNFWGLTSNDEFGNHKGNGKVVFGAPPNADKVSYQKYYCEKLNISSSTTLRDTLRAALDKVKDGAYREGGERFVPLYIWNTASFQSWYTAQKDAGNRLDHAEVLWNYRPSNSNFVFVWALKVKIYIKSEDRFKDNEFVLARTDVSSVCLYRKNKSFEDTEVILVKEFRSCAATSDGFIRELIGGSSTSDASPVDVAAEEVFEETGFHIDSNRLVQYTPRQLAGTFAAHKSHLFSAELTEDELKWFKAQDGVVHGKEEDSERTFIEVHTVKELLNNNLVDWSNLGQILAVIT